MGHFVNKLCAIGIALKGTTYEEGSYIILR
jgi:hypothetical protein